MEETLAAGTRLGPYDIVSLLGAGGMGQVYRARDARLGRDVAIKILSGTGAADLIGVGRFEAEAESTSFDNYGAWVRSRNWVTYVLNQPLVSEPGTTMEYSTGSTHLLSAMLTRATKGSTWAFLQESVGRPLGFTFSHWPRDPQGIYFGGNDMLMTPRQMVTFGQLYLNRGRVGDRQIVPAQWVDVSCMPRGRSRFNPDQTYGYGWWIRDFAGRQGCFAWGYGGQYIMLFRDLNLVVVITSSTAVSDERRDHRQQIFELVERLILTPLAGGGRSEREGTEPDSHEGTT